MPSFSETITEPEWDYTLIERDGQGKPIYDTGWKPRILDLDDYKVETHETNNLWLNVLNAKSKREELAINPTAPMLGRTREFYFKEGALAVFNSFEDHYPELHKHLLDIAQRLVVPEKKTIDTLDERDIYYSLAFEHLAAIAKAFNPSFNVHKLTV